MPGDALYLDIPSPAKQVLFPGQLSIGFTLLDDASEFLTAFEERTVGVR